MEAADKKKLYVLAAAVAVLISLWVYRAVTDTGKQAAPRDTAKQGRDAVQRPPRESVRVNLGLLDKEKAGLKVTRNIFSPVYRPPKVVPPPPPQRAVTVSPGAAQAVPVVPVLPAWKSPEEVQREVAMKEMGSIKFMGFVKRKGRTDVFMSMGNDFFSAAKGETITKDYYLKDIGANYLLFADRKSGAETRLIVDFEGSSADGPSIVPVVPVGSGGESGTGAAPARPARPSTPGARRPGSPDRAGGMPGGTAVNNPANGGGAGAGVPGGGTPYTPEPPDALVGHS